MYFLSEVLSPSKQRYPHYQKLAYGLFMTARKLRHYFSAHPIVVVNEAPLSNILNNPEATGRVSLWGIELSPRDITYEKRKAIKSQILPEFMAEWMEMQTTGPPDLSSTTTNKVAIRDGLKTSRKGHFSWLNTLPGRNGYCGGYRVPYGLATFFSIRGEKGLFSHKKRHRPAWVSGGH